MKRFALVLLCSGLVLAAPCAGGGRHGGSYRGGLARGPLLPPVGGTLPGYDGDEKRLFPRLAQVSGGVPGGRTLAPGWWTSGARSGLLPALPQARDPYRIVHRRESAPPGY